MIDNKDLSNYTEEIATIVANQALGVISRETATKRLTEEMDKFLAVQNKTSVLKSSFEIIELKQLVKNPELVDDLLSRLDKVSRDYCGSELGLPLVEDTTRAQLREQIYQWWLECDDKLANIIGYKYEGGVRDDFGKCVTNL